MFVYKANKAVPFSFEKCQAREVSYTVISRQPTDTIKNASFAESAQTLLNRFFLNEKDSSSDVGSHPRSEGEDDGIWGPLRALSVTQEELETLGNK